MLSAARFDLLANEMSSGLESGLLLSHSMRLQANQRLLVKVLLSCQRRGWNLDLFDLVSACLPDIYVFNLANLLVVDSRPTKVPLIHPFSRRFPFTMFLTGVSEHNQGIPWQVQASPTADASLCRYLEHGHDRM